MLCVGSSREQAYQRQQQSLEGHASFRADWELWAKDQEMVCDLERVPDFQEAVSTADLLMYVVMPCCVIPCKQQQTELDVGCSGPHSLAPRSAPLLLLANCLLVNGSVLRAMHRFRLGQGCPC